jgi:hypothetical protein
MGIDRTIEYIRDARKLNPEIELHVGTDQDINGRNDIVIASAMFHYVKDHDAFFRHIAQCSKLLIMDVWLSEDKGDKFVCSHRGLYIPTRETFEKIAGRYFGKIERKEDSLSPDNSQRYIYHLSQPKRIDSKALLIYGSSNVGKTTMAMEYEAIGYKRLSLDIVFMAWYKQNHKRMNIPYSVRAFADKITGELKDEYLEFHKRYIKKWLRDKIGHNIVIEGYDLSEQPYRKMVLGLLKDWETSKISLKKIWK